MLKAPLVAVAVLWSVACGGAPAESQAPAKAEPDVQPASGDEPERAEFMSQCAHKKEQEAFCSCSYDQAKQVLTPEEMGKSDLAPDRAQALRRAIGSNCTDKLPEQAVKDGFMARCSGQGPSLEGFCGCTWDALRKSMTVKEMAQLHRKDKRVQDAANACISQFPEPELEKSFLAGCVKDPSVEKYCRCAWTTLRREVTIADLALGGMSESESRDAYLKVKNECRKLAPQAPPK
jgi:hypothetical protein